MDEPKSPTASPMYINSPLPCMPVWGFGLLQNSETAKTFMLPNQENDIICPEQFFQEIELETGWLESGQCVFCHRILKLGTTEHHLIPRCCHRKKFFQRKFTRQQMHTTVPTCRDCHRAIHNLIPNEKDLAKEFFTVARLLNHEGFKRFVEWVKRRR